MKYKVKIHEKMDGVGFMSYTVQAKTMGEAMEKAIDDHRMLFMIEKDVELYATAKVEKESE